MKAYPACFHVVMAQASERRYDPSIICRRWHHVGSGLLVLCAAVLLMGCEPASQLAWSAPPRPASTVTIAAAPSTTPTAVASTTPSAPPLGPGAPLLGPPQHAGGNHRWTIHGEHGVLGLARDGRNGLIAYSRFQRGSVPGDGLALIDPRGQVRWVGKQEYGFAAAGVFARGIYSLPVSVGTWSPEAELVPYVTETVQLRNAAGKVGASIRVPAERALISGIAFDAKGEMVAWGHFVGRLGTGAALAIGDPAIAENRGGPELFVTKIDAQGTPLWAKGLGATTLGVGGVLLKPDGVVAILKDVEKTGLILEQLDRDGNTLATRTVIACDDVFTGGYPSGIMLPDGLGGFFLAVGVVPLRSCSLADAAWLMRVSSEGEVLWTRAFESKEDTFTLAAQDGAALVVDDNRLAEVGPNGETRWRAHDNVSAQWLAWYKREHPDGLVGCTNSQLAIEMTNDAAFVALSCANDRVASAWSFPYGTATTWLSCYSRTEE